MKLLQNYLQNPLATEIYLPQLTHEIPKIYARTIQCPNPYSHSMPTVQIHPNLPNPTTKTQSNQNPKQTFPTKTS